MSKKVVVDEELDLSRDWDSVNARLVAEVGPLVRCVGRDEVPGGMIYRRKNGSRRVVTNVTGETRTQAHFAKECDVNLIVKRYGGLSKVPNFQSSGFFADVSNLPDFQASLDLVRQANESFLSLPSEVRREFDNDPQKLITWLKDEKNRDKAVEYGLFAPPVKKERSAVDAIDDLRADIAPPVEPPPPKKSSKLAKQD